MIRDQVVNSCNSSKLRKKLLEEDNLTLEKVQQISRTYELSEVPAESSSTNGTSNEEVNRMRHVKPSRNKNKGARPKEYPQTTPVNQRARPHDRRQGEITAICYRCGEGGHYGKSCEKTKDVTCYACGGKRHFARMCNSKVKKGHVLLEDNEDNSGWLVVLGLTAL